MISVKLTLMVDGESLTLGAEYSGSSVNLDRVMSELRGLLLEYPIRDILDERGCTIPKSERVLNFLGK